jgi:hypothetical protein
MMDDHVVTDLRTGREVPVAELPTKTILAFIEAGKPYLRRYEATEKEIDDFLDRLDIEIIARRLGGRL